MGLEIGWFKKNLKNELLRAISGGGEYGRGNVVKILLTNLPRHDKTPTLAIPSKTFVSNVVNLQ